MRLVEPDRSRDPSRIVRAADHWVPCLEHDGQHSRNRATPLPNDRRDRGRQTWWATIAALNAADECTAMAEGTKFMQILSNSIAGSNFLIIQTDP